MRIAIAGFMHESNTFTGELTELRHFQEAFLHYGDELIPVWEDAHHELGGFIAGCREHELEMVPLLAAWATPKGPVTDEAYQTILDDLLARLREAQPFDGMLLALHGAMVTQSQLSADTETVRRVREALAPDIPLVLSLDMHANITEEMALLPNATVAYRTYPHVDQRDRGIECATLLARMLRQGARPVQAFRKLPLLMHIVQQYTGAGPLAEIFAELDRSLLVPGMLSASVAPGYIYADTPHMGVSVVTIADGDAALAAEQADTLAQFIMNRREALNATLPDVPAAVTRAAAIEGTVCLMDSGDNIGGGGPGDSTIIFAELLRQGVPRVCVVLYDPQAAAACARAFEEYTQSMLSPDGEADLPEPDRAGKELSGKRVADLSAPKQRIEMDQQKRLSLRWWGGNPDDSKFAENMEAEFGVPVVKPSERDIPERICSMIDGSVAMLYRVIPLEENGNTLRIATANPSLLSKLDELSSLLDRPVELVLASPEEIRDALARYYGLHGDTVEDMLAVLSRRSTADSNRQGVIEGNRIQLHVGAKTDSQHGHPIPISGIVVNIHPGEFTEPEPRHGGTRIYNQGLTAVVQTDDGHTVVLNSLRVMPTSLQQLLSLGIVPAACKVIVVKGVTAPRAAYDPIAAEVIPVDSPGVTQAGPEAFGYHNRPHPLYPLDPLPV